MPRTPTPPRLRDRILDLRRIPARDLQDHQMNWRTHPQAQQDAMRGVLDELGIAAALLVYESPRQGGLCIIDGHLRKSLDPAQEWPCLVLDLNDDEAAYLLATYDPLGAMATASADALRATLEAVQSGAAAVQQLLDDIAVKHGVVPPVDYAKEWQGMPAFAQEAQADYQRIIVHFASAEAVAAFAALVEQPITPDTKYLYYPALAKDALREQSYAT
jgi:hypothetical protein